MLMKKVLYTALFCGTLAQIPAHASNDEAPQVLVLNQAFITYPSLKSRASLATAQILCDAPSTLNFDSNAWAEDVGTFLSAGGFKALGEVGDTTQIQLTEVSQEQREEVNELYGRTIHLESPEYNPLVIPPSLNTPQITLLNHLAYEAVLSENGLDYLLYWSQVSQEVEVAFYNFSSKFFGHFLTADLTYDELVNSEVAKYLDHDVLLAYQKRDDGREKLLHARQAVVDIMNQDRSLSDIERSNPELALSIKRYYPLCVEYDTQYELGLDFLEAAKAVANASGTDSSHLTEKDIEILKNRELNEALGYIPSSTKYYGDTFYDANDGILHHFLGV